MPNQPKTPVHSFRIPPPVWERATAKAAKVGEPTMTAVVVRLLDQWSKP